MDRQIALTPDKNQDPQGVLITLDSQNKEQDSRGDLKYSQINQSISSQPVIAELDIPEIQPFQYIPDYTCPTISPHPIVVISPTSCHCIDGWDLIQKAKSTDKSKIACHIFYIPEYSETEVAIQKVAIRTMPIGGTCSYAELVRNANILFNMLLASSENPVVFSHGGARRGSAYAGNREDNIRVLLAERLGKSITTINKYLNHHEYLSEETMCEILASDEGKKFFEEAQRNKRILIKNMKSDEKSEEEITAQISKQMISWLKEYQSTEEIKTDFGVEEEPDSPDNENFATNKNDKEKQADFNPWQGNSEEDNERESTFEGVRDEYKAICEMGINDTEDQELNLNKLKSSAESSIQKLAVVLQKIKALQVLENSDADKEAE
jgi:O6-methylguanine-DNA--protein-cysteine methyltransferase